MRAPSWGRAARAVAAYGVILLACCVILGWIMKVWNDDLTAPYGYSGDGLLHQLWVKAVIENGWYLHNELLGMPFGMDVHDYPQSESVHLLVVKALSIFCNDAATVFNVYNLLAFPLITLTSVLVLRSFNISFVCAGVVSLLFTFLPYHFYRMAYHPYLAAYYLVPLALWPALWLLLGRDLFFAYDEGRHKLDVRRFHSASFASVVICILVASGGIYYAYFACFFFLAAGIACLFRGARYQFYSALLLIGCTSLALVANLAPTIVYVYQHGYNHAVVRRTSDEAEEYGLKITTLLLPQAEHRLPAFDRLRKEYDDTTKLNNENKHAGLGLIGGLGFLIMTAGALFARRADRKPGVIEAAGFLGIAGVLLATIAGFGTVFSFLGLTWIRGYDRISIFIAFLSFLSVACVIEHSVARRMHGVAARLAFYGGMSALLILGLMDLIPPNRHTVYKERTKDINNFRNDGEFVSAIEATVPHGAMIYQLPSIAFYEIEGTHRTQPYDPLRGYLRSRSLRWSYGGIDGREATAWHYRVNSQSLDDMLKTISIAGFSGIWLDRWAFADSTADLETRLKSHLEIAPIISPDGRFSFFNLAEYNRRLADRYSVQEWEVERRVVLNPVLIVFGKGVLLPEMGERGHINKRWCQAESEFYVSNPNAEARTVTLDATLHSDLRVPTDVEVTSALFNARVRLDGSDGKISQTFTVPPGKHRVRLVFDPDHPDVPDDLGHVFLIVDIRMSDGSDLPADKRDE